MTKDEKLKKFMTQEMQRKGRDSDKMGNIYYDVGINIPEPESIPFGIEKLDALTNGGIQRGRFTQIWGKKGCGKTTLALHLIKQFQDRKLYPLYIDFEGKWSRERAEMLGVDLEKIFIVNAEKMESVFNALIAGLSKYDGETIADLIVIDSIASGSSVGEHQYIEARDVMQRAALLTKFLNAVSVPIQNQNITVLIINQSRINMTQMGAFGDKTPGGNALDHQISMDLKLTRKLSSDIPSTVDIKILKSKKKGVIDGKDTTITLGVNGFTSDDWLDPVFKGVLNCRIAKTYITINGTRVPKIDLENLGEDFITTAIKKGDLDIILNKTVFSALEENPEE